MKISPPIFHLSRLAAVGGSTLQSGLLCTSLAAVSTVMYIVCHRKRGGHGARLASPTLATPAT